LYFGRYYYFPLSVSLIMSFCFAETFHGTFQLEYSGVVERRRQTKEDHERLIQEELEKMEEELKEEKVSAGKEQRGAIHHAAR